MQDLSLGRRFGFVNFESCKDAKAAVKAMHGIMVRSGTKPMHVERFMSKAERQSQTAEPYFYSPFPMRSIPDTLNREGRNIYVKHLAPDVDEMILFSIFHQVCKCR